MQIPAPSEVIRTLGTRGRRPNAYWRGCALWAPTLMGMKH